MTHDPSTPAHAVAPPWSPENRLRIQRAMDAVIRAADDVLHRRSSAGHWWPPAETEAGDVSALITTGRRLVLTPLEEVLGEARATLDDVERQVREYRGLVRTDERGES